jgi:hypothetical protein
MSNQPVAFRLRNTAFRQHRYEYHDTRQQAEDRQADFNRSVDDGGLHGLTPLYAEPPRSTALLTEALDLVPRISDDDPMAPALAEWCGKVRAALRAADRESENG